MLNKEEEEEGVDDVKEDLRKENLTGKTGFNRGDRRSVFRNAE